MRCGGFSPPRSIRPFLPDPPLRPDHPAELTPERGVMALDEFHGSAPIQPHVAAKHVTLESHVGTHRRRVPRQISLGEGHEAGDAGGARE